MTLLRVFLVLYLQVTVASCSHESDHPLVRGTRSSALNGLSEDHESNERSLFDVLKWTKNGQDSNNQVTKIVGGDTVLVDETEQRQDVLHVITLEPRIVGGQEVEETDHSFSYYVHTVSAALCGGALIYPDIVVTAAHCQGSFSRGVWIDSTTKNGGTMIGVDSHTNHPRFNPRNFQNDIALVKLQKPAVGITPVVFNTNGGLPKAGAPVQVIGFGALSENGPLSPVLMEVVLDVAPSNYCSRFSGFSPSLMICAGGTPQGGYDACQGDSGGPMLDPTTGELVGIVSAGLGCARPGTPAIYTRISTYEAWIKETACQLSDVPGVCPTDHPSKSPSVAPSEFPSDLPSEVPTTFPSLEPSLISSSQPSLQPSAVSSETPSMLPSLSVAPSVHPSALPSTAPSTIPSSAPTAVPSAAPTFRPTGTPSNVPTGMASAEPSRTPTYRPSMVPSLRPTSRPTLSPTISTLPSAVPTATPSFSPTHYPSSQPTSKPTASAIPSTHPSTAPSATPSMHPSLSPTTGPTSSRPSTLPTTVRSKAPSQVPSPTPSTVISTAPSSVPTNRPSMHSHSTPSAIPSQMPSLVTTETASVNPSSMPSGKPTLRPSLAPASVPANGSIFYGTETGGWKFSLRQNSTIQENGDFSKKKGRDSGR